MFTVESIQDETYYPLFDYAGVPIVTVRLRDTGGHSHFFSRARDEDSIYGTDWHYDAHLGPGAFPYHSAGNMQGRTINRDACQPGGPGGELLNLLDTAFNNHTTGE